MNIKIGDTVRFLNEKGEGTVTKIINKTTVGVTIEDGFELPFLISDLVLIQDTTSVSVSENITRSPAVSDTTRKIISKERKQEGIFVAFSPEKINDIVHTDFNAWLINDTSYKILYTYSIFQNDHFVTLDTGAIQPFDSLLIETIEKKSLTDYSDFKIDILFFNETRHQYQQPVSEIIKLKPVKLYKENTFTENNFISEKALIIEVLRLNESDESKTTPQKTDLSKILFQKKNYSEHPKKSKPHIHNNPAYEMEVDLHIEELLDNYSGLSNAEIIQVQLKYFQKKMDQAISEHYRKLIVIHGIGNGRLKEEVRKILSTNNLRFYDASYTRYGFGATEVIIS